MLSFLVRKVFALLATLLFVTLILYGIAMLTPPEVRATLFMPSTNAVMSEARLKKTTEIMIERYGLDQPYLVQYGRWLGRLLHGDLGFSPAAHSFVLDALLTRLPATAELILFSLLVFIPGGVVAGLFSGSRHGGYLDRMVRFSAYMAASLPPFILGLVLLAVFWVGLKWFSIGRIEISTMEIVRSASFQTYTGLLTIDGLLNKRPDIALDALRHLVLPVLTVSLLHWATLARLTRTMTIDEDSKEYVLAARGRGLRERRILWVHILPNVFVPALNSSALSVASLITGLFVIESIFLFNGVSSMITVAFTGVPDISLALGFVLFSVTAVLLVMTVLDVLQAAVDPLVREEAML